MIKFALAAASAAALMTIAPLTVPAQAQNVQLTQGAQVQQVGYRDRDDWNRRRDRDVTVGVGPGGLRVGPREHCRYQTTRIERDGRTITKRERICD